MFKTEEELDLARQISQWVAEKAKAEGATAKDYKKWQTAISKSSDYFGTHFMGTSNDAE